MLARFGQNGNVRCIQLIRKVRRVLVAKRRFRGPGLPQLRGLRPVWERFGRWGAARHCIRTSYHSVERSGDAEPRDIVISWRGSCSWSPDLA